ncbi:hypothetical protein HY623_01135 [Candidatus Uhrbacteria bacterium]|nr:hypothetical protein [Candidatus Uhrbacteria bacterium]
MKNHMKAEFGPFELPQPHDNDRDHNPEQSGQRPQHPEREKIVITDPQQYQHALENVAKIISAKEYTGHQHSFFIDIQGEDDSVIPSRYIDAFVTARRAYRIPDYKKSGDWIRKPAFVIHTYAVSDMFDDRGRTPLRTENDIAGYYLTAGTAGNTYGMFVRTHNRQLLKGLHETLVKLCSKKSEPKNPQTAIQELYEQYNNTQHNEASSVTEFIWKGIIPRTPIPGMPLLSIVQELRASDRPEDDTLSEESIERSSYDRERRKRMRIAALRNHDEQQVELPDYCPRGYLSPRRRGDRRVYIDEIISGRSDGIYLHTRGIDLERKPLMKPTDITAYKTTFGLEPFAYDLIIYTKDRADAVKVHAEIIERAQHIIHDPAFSPLHILRALAEEYNRGRDMPFIRVLTAE